MWIAAGFVACVRVGVPGAPHRGPVPPPDADLLERAARVERTLHALATTIGPRSAHQEPHALRDAAAWIESAWASQGYPVERQEVGVFGGVRTYNLIARTPGAQPPLVVGAHYDTVPGSPGADDNATGVAALLELSRTFAPDAGEARGRAVHFVAWTTEEPPFFAADAMGSAVHAASADAHAAIAIDAVGTYRDARGSQRRPFPLSLVVPSTGDFVAFVGTPSSHRFVREVSGSFRAVEPFPTRGGSAPPWIPGIDWSDHRSYAARGVPAVLVTDTSAFRSPHYHEPTDAAETVDPVAVARISRGLEQVVREIVATASAPQPTPPSIDALRPDRIEMTRGGRVKMSGEGLDEATRVWVGERPVRVTRLHRGSWLEFQVPEDWRPGTYDVRVANEAGEATRAAALLVELGPPPPPVPCAETVYFDHDSAEVSGEAARQLERARFCITLAGGPVDVIGHTDASGESTYNERLGLEQAEAVAAWLRRFGVEDSRLRIRSAGASEATGSSESQRRVDVRTRPSD